jgi:hypothetical protein
MAEIRPAAMSDRDAVLRFLGGATGSRRPYGRLFDYPWRRPEWNTGYLLAVDGEVRGFLGHVYSERIVGGRPRRLANQTTWFVDPAHRRFSLDLFRAALQEPDAIFTNFSANATVRRILETHGFRLLDTGKTIVSPHHGLLDLAGLEITPLGDASEAPDPQTARILTAHLPLGCKAFDVARGSTRGLVVVLRRLYKGIPYADLLHAAVPPELFLPLGALLIAREKVVALGVPRRFLGARRLLVLDNRRPSYYAAVDVDPRDIDTLYSEFPLLYGAPR